LCGGGGATYSVGFWDSVGTSIALAVLAGTTDLICGRHFTLASGGTLTVTSGGASITGNSTITGTLGVTGLITATGGVVINGGAAAVGAIFKGAGGGFSIQLITGSSNDFSINNVANTSSVITVPTGTEHVYVTKRLFIGAMASTNSADGTFGLSNSSAPGGNPTAGGFLWVESGALKYRGTSGTVTTLATA
jgi:hypothetical protein